MKYQERAGNDQSWADTVEDDISALRRIAALPELPYQDVGQQQQLALILQRWPLLAESCLARDEEG